MSNMKPPSPKFRLALPQLVQMESKGKEEKTEDYETAFYLTDGGMETTLVFEKGMDLPEFAAFPFVESHAKTFQDYYRLYLKLAEQYNHGIILESATWRANPDWADKIEGYGTAQDPDGSKLARANIASIEIMEKLRADFPSIPVILSGCIGPRGDGYVAEALMTSQQAKDYHAAQIQTIARQTAADLVSGMTLNYAEEAIGIALAAKEEGIPCVISFTLETDGKLPTGQSLKDAIRQIDEATDKYPAYYMINCAHPTHFEGALAEDLGSPELERVSGLRANASCKSHAELDEATELDAGDPVELGQHYQKLLQPCCGGGCGRQDRRRLLPRLNIVGGCCGTDERHVEEMAKAIKATA